ncbi:UNVERIFIED_CONTAM: hypothetical protein Slati_0337100 [Sesamum latifolium]|uniref:Uncharacterized protein n=1 Tax=Sesamum latifolium TaxID=2727402 RepID=A0AAW2YFF2_9LAMI
MASFSQPPFFSSLVPIKKTSTLAFSSQPTKFLTFKNSKISSSYAESQENSPETQPQEEDPVKLAFAKAKAYRSSTQSSNPAPRVVESPLQEPYATVDRSDGDASISDELEDGDVSKEVPLAVKLALEKAKEYKKSKSLVKSEGVVSEIVQSSGVESAKMEENDGLKADEVRDDGGQKEVPLAVKLALEKAKEYRKNKGVVGGEDGGSETLTSGFNRGNEGRPGDKQSIKNYGKKEDFSISSIDFVGLGFSDKKSGRSLPAGLVPISDPFPEGELPEVEILVGDTSKFGDAAAAEPIPVEEDNAELYKPKVSTWGVFPRPSDISRTALKDGDSLMDLGELKEALPFYEKVMEKLAFQSELHGLAALQWSICQDSLSRCTFFFNTYSVLAATDVNIPNEARMMYEKLQSHPSPQVSKRARQFFFSFQKISLKRNPKYKFKAMEMMKVTSSTRSRLSTGYQNYFEAFLQDKTNYSLKEDQVDEGGLNQALPMLFF